MKKKKKNTEKKMMETPSRIMHARQEISATVCTGLDTVCQNVLHKWTTQSLGSFSSLVSSKSKVFHKNS